MKLETVNVADLKPLEKNVRYHTEIQINEFARSLKQFGQTRPFVIDEDNNILIGNCMFMAMKQSGVETATAYRMKGLSQAKKKKLILSDNRIYSLGGDNAQAIEDYIKEIVQVEDFEIAGFDESVLKELIRDSQEIEQSVMSYGVVSQEVIEKAQQNIANNSQPSHAQSAPETNAQPEYGVRSEDAQSAEVVKTVVCPNCGEVIRI